MFKKSIKNTLWQILGKGIMVLVGIATVGFLTRKLGTEAYGSYTLLISVFLLFDALADFGTKIIGVKEISQEENENKKKNIFGQTVYLRLIMTGISFVLASCFILFWNGFDGIRIEAFLSLLMMWFTSIAGSLEIIYQTKMRLDLKVIMDVIFPLAFFLMILIWPGMVSLKLVFIGYLAARILSLVIGYKIIGSEFPVLKIKIDVTILREIFKQAWPMGLYLIIFTSYDRAVDSIMIKNFLGFREVAWYGLSYKIYSTLLQPAYFFVASIFPLLSSKKENRKRLFFLSLIFLTAGVLGLILIVYVLAPWIITTLAGQGFEQSVSVLRILLIATFFSYLGHLTGFTLISQGKQKAMLKLGLVVLIFNLVANLLTIPHFGIKAAAFVTGGSEALGFGLMAWKLWKDNK